MRKEILKYIEENKNDFVDLSHYIHQNPETGFKEFKAVSYIKKILEKNNFNIKNPVANLETAFKANYGKNDGGPTIAFLAEYDALQGLGHGCGHNIIAASSVGAAIALSKIINNIGGKVVIIGTPAEETEGGKILLLKNGIFSDVDYALMMHPTSNNSVFGRGGLAAVSFELDFYGKKAHSSVPEEGINALTAIIEVFNNINVLRDRFPQHKINGIITSGGEASNVIPDESSAEILIRAKKTNDLDLILKEIKKAIKAASMLTGAHYDINLGLKYAERYPNLVMGKIFKKNIKKLNENIKLAGEEEGLGSSDVGNISKKIPIIHPYIKIADNVNMHSKEFVNASISKRADEVVIKAAKSLALTGHDILCDKEIQNQINIEYNEMVLNKK